MGPPHRLDDVLDRSEDSDTLNTSFIERLQLTIRQGVPMLRRRDPAHARRPEHLVDQVGLFHCYYNFMRKHSALKFGYEMRTPAMQAGIAKRPLTWRRIFTAVAGFSILVLLRCRAQGIIQTVEQRVA